MVVVPTIRHLIPMKEEDTLAKRPHSPVLQLSHPPGILQGRGNQSEILAGIATEIRFPIEHLIPGPRETTCVLFLFEKSLSLFMTVRTLEAHFPIGAPHGYILTLDPDQGKPPYCFPDWIAMELNLSTYH